MDFMIQTNENNTMSLFQNLEYTTYFKKGQQFQIRCNF
ncbi:hypothetical protein LEP1GSC057_2521 [Leptospira interrogans str. Brem 329]|nr:hypothetical protein LEP1GSC057_2521 [Leptospira interrogans str. Brem 329]